MEPGCGENNPSLSATVPGAVPGEFTGAVIPVTSTEHPVNSTNSTVPTNPTFNDHTHLPPIHEDPVDFSQWHLWTAQRRIATVRRWILHSESSNEMQLSEWPTAFTEEWKLVRNQEQEEVYSFFGGVRD